MAAPTHPHGTAPGTPDRRAHLLSLDGVGRSRFDPGNAFDLVGVAIAEHRAAAAFRNGDLLIVAAPRSFREITSFAVPHGYRLVRPASGQSGAECLLDIVRNEFDVLRRFGGVAVSGRGRGFGRLVAALDPIGVEVVRVRSGFDLHAQPVRPVVVPPISSIGSTPKVGVAA